MKIEEKMAKKRGKNFIEKQMNFESIECDKNRKIQIDKIMIMNCFESKLV